MNYRHSFHAGNFADCVKHAMLVEILSAMQRKAKPLLVLDTHAGIGRYDLASGGAEKTGEWKDGIARIMAARPVALANYITTIETLGLYPGSPLIAATALRTHDRLICCELHPHDAPLLRANLAAYRQAAVHERDGYAAMKAFLPPPERRALVLIDPPFERADEFFILAQSLADAYAKFRNGVFVVWYPIKHRAPVRAFCETLVAHRIRDIINVEFLRRPPLDPVALNGCGLLVINPPFGFEDAARPMLQAFINVLGEPGGACAVERIADE